MKKYTIEIRETFSRTVSVEAENFYDALDAVEEDYKNGFQVLSSNDFLDVEFNRLDEEPVEEQIL